MLWTRAFPLILGLAPLGLWLALQGFASVRNIILAALLGAILTATYHLLRKRPGVRSCLKLATTIRYPLTSILAVAITLFLALLPSWIRGHFPYPLHQDEHSYHLAADTFAHGRFSNPTPAGWEHFESFHINVVPSYYSKYQPGMGLTMALGQVVLGHTYFGMLLALVWSVLVLDWMFHLWLPNRWASLATLIACLQIVMNWGDGYFISGPLATGAGALLLGIYQLILRRGVKWTDGVCLASVLVIFFWTRPFEGAVFSLCLGIPLLIHIVKSSGLKPLLWPLLPSALLVLTPAVIFQTRLNQATTGSPWQLPYLAHENQYGGTPLFLFSSPRTDIPEYQHEQFRIFHSEMLNLYHAHKSSENIGAVIAFRYKVAWIFFYSFLCFLPLATFPELLADARTRFLLQVCLVFFLGIQVATWFLHHYVAPGLAAWSMIVVMAYRYVRTWIHQGRPVGRYICLWCLAAFVSFALLRWASATHDSLDKTSYSERKAVLSNTLKQRAPRHLVFVEYGPNHHAGAEWVYNTSDIESQPIIWARAMDHKSNKKLAQLYPGRSVWLLTENSKDPENQSHIRSYDVQAP